MALRRLVALTCILIAGACSDSASPPESTTTTSRSSTTSTSTTSTTTTTTPITTTTIETPQREDDHPGPAGVEVFLPDDPRGAPSIILLHGGGWVAGSPSSTRDLATQLAREGAIVYNTGYPTLVDGGGYPQTFDSIACAVRFASEHSRDLGGADELTLAGHSAGAHLGAVVALSDDSFGSDCEWAGTSTPDRLIGLAGIYDPARVEPVMELFLGGAPYEIPEIWEVTGPLNLVEGATDMEIVLVHGDADRIASVEDSAGFADALEAIGADVTLQIVPGATHNDMLRFDVVGSLLAR